MFPSTHHTLLNEAIRGEEGQLNRLLEVYWQPCFRYVRWRFHVGHEEAEDLVQGFFAYVIEKEVLSRFDWDKGKFRPFLRVCFDRFVMKRIERPAEPVSDEVADSSQDPEEMFEREWERQVFALAIETLKGECASSGREVRFAIFEAYDLAEETRPSYEDLALQFQLPVTTVTNHLAWARKELRRLVQR
jgi:RNA polymerase sigma factor (sigma-70 family)